MRATCRLLQTCRITLFTRENCGLCTEARSVLSNVWDARPFQFKEIDIIKSDTKERWRDLYEFDVPVVCYEQSSNLFTLEVELILRQRLMETYNRFTSASVQPRWKILSRLPKLLNLCINSPPTRSKPRWTL
ncbi:hypothetical protein F5Y06DRAFT_215533 [Hypoxylon sp. FL0890]|nr:hypothetical protein F5Y06DRAFT_215533 [Hypoxylon sp. FL0890]